MPDAKVGDRMVSCSFLKVDRTGGSLVQAEMCTHTGSSPWRLRLRQSAHCYAHENGLRMWAMPCLVQDSGDWLVYEENPANTSQAMFLQRLPTRDAAEMWMMHHAE